ncbi:preprotein translocase subunit YajC [Arthrobacter sp. JSM 101049]|uniref:preprotein translocase subunit YajC n=1 Tax=Arthrobacter sp. JSM 101049 TaxID=929097 RepID=UPI00356550B7
MTSTILAQAAAPSGFDPMTLILILAFAFLIFMMFRGRKKAQKQQEQLRSQLEPGSEVMTNFGLFGTVVAINPDDNKVTLEISPGTTATVHSQAIAKVVPVPAPEAQDEAPAGQSSGDETAEETLRRLDSEGKNQND